MARTSAKAKKPKQDPKKAKSTSNNEQEEKKHASTDDTGNSTDKENEENNYEVEKIIHTRVYRGKRQYLVRWKGYKEDSDTWENESTVQSCSEALELFKKENPDKTDSDGEAEDEESQESEEEEEKGEKRTKTPTKSGKKSKKPKDEKPKEKEKKTTQLSSDSEDESEQEIEEKSDEVGKGKKMPNKGAKQVTKKKSNVEVEEPKNKKKKKSDNSDSDNDSVTDGKNYEVDKILEVHWKRDGSREFLIRWKGYKPSDDTWEPEAHLDCQELIEKFMEKVDKAKSMPARELRESRTPTTRFIPVVKTKGQRSHLRNKGFRPSYTE